MVKKYSKWSPKAMGRCCGIFGFIAGIAGIVWHAGLGQPTLAQLLYPWFSLAEPLMALGTLIAFTAIGYISGYLWAVVYNWALKWN